MSTVPLNKENIAGWTKFKGATNKVVSKGPKEGVKMHRLTSAATPELAQLYADYQNSNNKAAFLMKNRAIIDKYDIVLENCFSKA